MSFLLKQKYIFFALVYFTQGVALSYLRNFQKNHLIDEGIPLSQAGMISSLLLIPFILKFIWGYWSDRWTLGSSGKRKPFILAGLFLSFISFFGLSFFSPSESMQGYFVLMLLLSLGVSLYDSSTDAWAIENSSMSEQGKIQGLMLSSRAIAFISFSYLIGIWSTRVGFEKCFLFFSFFFLFTFFYSLSYKKLGQDTAPPAEIRNPFRLLNKSILYFLLYAFVYCLALFAMDGVLMVYLKQELGYNDQQIGLLSALRGAGTVLGALGIALLYKLKTPRSQIGFGILLAIGIFYTALLYGFPLSLITSSVLCVVWGLLYGLKETYFVTRAMEFSPLKAAGFVFAFYMAIGNLGTSVSEGLTAQIIENKGYPFFFAVGIVLTAAALLSHSLISRVKLSKI